MTWAFVTLALACVWSYWAMERAEDREDGEDK